ncbi:MAG: class I SAM-dependent methyltransferase, partial [Bacteriovorax sp.]|nr:class I SAM-dependent methyltransferase [Bacteriovorax sp.]
MLQLTNFYEKCYQDFRQSPQTNIDDLDLEKLKLISKLLFKEIDQKRSTQARKNLLYYLDQLIWTDAREHIDDPQFNVQTKQEIIQGLHLKNNLFGTYNKTIKILEPLITQINEIEKRPAKILELGSGTGKLTMAMYEKTKNTSMKIQITGSDIIPEYVLAANNEAISRNLKIDFKVIDAFHLDRLEHNSYDIIFTLHSMHHFLPEQLAMIMSGSQKVTTKAFIGIDGYRGFGNLLFMTISGIGASMYNLDTSFFHDSMISGRKMYSSKQLEIIAKIGCPQSTVVSENL